MPLSYGDTARWGLANLFVPAQRGGRAVGSITGAVSINLGALTSSSGVTWSNPPSSANQFELTATGNVTSLAVTNGVTGVIYNLMINFAGFTAPSSMTNFDPGANGFGTLTTTSGKQNLISGMWLSTGSLRGAVNPG